MNFSNFLAAGSELNGSAAIITTILPFVLLIVVMYFMIIRPQRKKEKETQNMRNSIQVGDIVVTIGGIEGIVVNIKEDTILLESGDNRNKIRVKRWAIQTNETVHEEQKTETAKKKKVPFSNSEALFRIRSDCNAKVQEEGAVNEKQSEERNFVCGNRMVLAQSDVRKSVWSVGGTAFAACGGVDGDKISDSGHGSFRNILCMCADRKLFVRRIVWNFVPKKGTADWTDKRRRLVVAAHLRQFDFV